MTSSRPKKHYDAVKSAQNTETDLTGKDITYILLVGIIFSALPLFASLFSGFTSIITGTAAAGLTYIIFKLVKSLNYVND